MSDLEAFLLQLPRDLRDGIEQLAERNINDDKMKILEWFFSQKIRKEPLDFKDVAKLLKRHFNNRVDVVFNVDDVRFRVMVSCRDLPKEVSKKQEEEAA